MRVSFTLAWSLAAFVLAAVYAVVGRVTRRSVGGLLVDSRERYSLNHFQLLTWTLLVLSTMIASFVSSGFDVAALEIPPQLVVLMGISLGSAAASGAVKSLKDGMPGVTIPHGNPMPSQILLEEEGRNANKVVSVTKFQSVAFTVVGALVFTVLTLKAQDYPVVPEQVLWLLGTSQAGYIAGKVPPTA